MNDQQFFRRVVIVNGMVPLVLLGWDAFHGQLGANAVNSSLRATGLLSLICLCLTLLMSPLHWVSRWGGWIACRRALGLYAFGYAALHLTIYVLFDRAADLSSTFYEIWMRRFLQIGALAFFLMVPLAITSTNQMIQWLGPRRWKALHRAVYLTAILAVTHYYLLVKSDVRQPLAFAVVVGLLLVARIVHHYLWLRSEVRKASATKHVDHSGGQRGADGRSDRAWKGNLRVAAIFRETTDVKTFRLVAADGGTLPFTYRAGQFVGVELMIDGQRVRRSYTLASTPTRSYACELTIRRDPNGTASQFLHDRVAVGDMLKISGPSGRFVFDEHESNRVLLVAGGVGITPLMSILRSLTDRGWPGQIYFLVSARDEADLIFRDELNWITERFPTVHLRVTLSRCAAGSMWLGDRGRISESLLADFVPQIAELPAYVCGPNPMMDEVCGLLTSLGVPAERVRTEAFSGKRSTSATDRVSDATLNADDSARTQAVIGGREPSTIASAESPNHGLSVTFSRAGVEIEVSSDATVLEAAESAEVSLSYECRSGFCGQCKTRLVDGKVSMDVEDALSAKERADGWILACQARPLSPVTVDA